MWPDFIGDVHRAAATFVLASLALLSADRALAISFIYTSIDVPSATETIARGINDQGQIVGSFRDVSGGLHGFLRSDSGYVQLDLVPSPFPFPAQDTQAYAINDSGEVVGIFRGQFGQDSFLLSGGSYRVLIGGGDGPTVASGINDAGQVVGRVFDGEGDRVDIGWLWDDGHFTFFRGASCGFDCFTPLSLNGINDAGVIVGDTANAPFLLSGGTFTPLDVPGVPRAINDSGEIVGSFLGADFVEHGYLLSDGNLITLDFPGASGTLAYGINDSGSIVGEYTAGGVRHGFLATVVPEPSTLALLGFGTLALARFGSSAAASRRGR